MLHPELMPAAMKVVTTCLEVKAGESALVVTDSNMGEIAESFLSALHAIGNDAVLMLMSPRCHSGEEPPPHVGQAMAASDVSLLVTSKSLSHTQARLQTLAAGGRIASMPGITQDMMTVGGLTADYYRVAKLSRAIVALLNQADSARITTARGTDIQMSLSGRVLPKPPDDGFITRRGQFGNLPGGEAAIAPIEESVEGVLVVDGSVAPTGRVREAIAIEIRHGQIERIEGGYEAQELKQFLWRFDESARVVGELGIGTNEKARVTGNILEDEKSLGTFHLGFGTNIGMGGQINAQTHNDVVVLKPDIFLDEKQIMKAGVPVLDQGR